MTPLSFDKACVKNGWLCLHVLNLPYAREFLLKMVDGIVYDCDLKRHREKRSLDANSYMWKLCQLLGNATMHTKEDIYRNAIRRVGEWKDWHDLTTQDAKELAALWGASGTGWISEQVDFEPDGNHVVLRTYYGSSRYNSKQMARLIDDLKEDCEACDIETLTPRDLSLLLDEWEKKNG